MIFVKYFLITIFIVSTINAKEPEKVKLRLDWLHQFQFAGYYMAKEKGFFNELGLDVEILEYNYGVNQVQEVLDQKVDFSIGKSSLIIDKINGKNIVTLAAIYQNSPMVLLTTNLSIKSPKDLYGKKVMLTEDARTAVAINSMITSKGLNLDDINFQKHSFKIEDLIEGKTDAMGSYISNEPFILKNKNIKYNILDPKDYGFDFYGGILFTSKYTLNSNPEKVQNFQKAILKGWDYAFSNIEESIKVIMDKYNTQKKSYSALKYEAETLKELSGYEENKLGKLEIAKLEEIKKIYSLMGHIPYNKELKDFVLFPKDVILTKIQKSFLQKNTINYYTFKNKPFYTKLGGKSIETEILSLLKSKVNMDIKIVQEEIKNTLLNKYTNDTNGMKILLPNEKLPKNSQITNAITSFPYGILSQNSNTFISSLNLLDNKKVAIVNDNFLRIRLQNDYPNIEVLYLNNFKKAKALLENGEVSAIIILFPFINEKLKVDDLTKIKIAGTTDFKYPIRYIVNSENKILLAILNKIIKRLETEKINNINLKYSVFNNSLIKQPISNLVFIAILILVISILLFINLKLNKEVRRRKNLEKKLNIIAHTDELTNIYNRRKLIRLLINNLHLSKRYGRPISIIFFDIDDFKYINDTFGHPVGDFVLQKISTLVNDNIRSSDIFGRWGGEEFLIILPETTLNNAQRTAENLREIIANTKFDSNFDITASFGVTTLQNNDTKKSLLQRADENMYFIKRNGKNGVKAD